MPVSALVVDSLERSRRGRLPGPLSAVVGGWVFPARRRALRHCSEGRCTSGTSTRLEPREMFEEQPPPLVIALRLPSHAAGNIDHTTQALPLADARSRVY